MATKLNLHSNNAPEQILDKLIFLNPHSNLNFNSGNPFYCNFSVNAIIYDFTIIRDVKCTTLALLLTAN